MAAPIAGEGIGLQAVVSDDFLRNLDAMAERRQEKADQFRLREQQKRQDRNDKYEWLAETQIDDEDLKNYPAMYHQQIKDIHDEALADVVNVKNNARTDGDLSGQYSKIVMDMKRKLTPIVQSTSAIKSYEAVTNPDFTTKQIQIAIANGKNIEDGGQTFADNMVHIPSIQGQGFQFNPQNNTLLGKPGTIITPDQYQKQMEVVGAGLLKTDALPQYEYGKTPEGQPFVATYKSADPNDVAARAKTMASDVNSPMFQYWYNNKLMATAQGYESDNFIKWKDADGKPLSNPVVDIQSLQKEWEDELKSKADLGARQYISTHYEPDYTEEEKLVAMRAEYASQKSPDIRGFKERKETYEKNINQLAAENKQLQKENDAIPVTNKRERDSQEFKDKEQKIKDNQAKIDAQKRFIEQINSLIGEKTGNQVSVKHDYSQYGGYVLNSKQRFME